MHTLYCVTLTQPCVTLITALRHIYHNIASQPAQPCPSRLCPCTRMVQIRASIGHEGMLVSNGPHLSIMVYKGKHNLSYTIFRMLPLTVYLIQLTLYYTHFFSMLAYTDTTILPCLKKPKIKQFDQKEQHHKHRQKKGSTHTTVHVHMHKVAVRKVVLIRTSTKTTIRKLVLMQHPTN